MEWLFWLHHEECVLWLQVTADVQTRRRKYSRKMPSVGIQPSISLHTLSNWWCLYLIRNNTMLWHFRALFCCVPCDLVKLLCSVGIWLSKLWDSCINCYKLYLQPHFIVKWPFSILVEWKQKNGKVKRSFRLCLMLFTFLIVIRIWRFHQENSHCTAAGEFLCIPSNNITGVWNFIIIKLRRACLKILSGFFQAGFHLLFPWIWFSFLCIERSLYALF